MSEILSGCAVRAEIQREDEQRLLSVHEAPPHRQPFCGKWLALSSYGDGKGGRRIFTGKPIVGPERELSEEEVAEVRKASEEEDQALSRKLRDSIELEWLFAKYMDHVGQCCGHVFLYEQVRREGAPYPEQDSKIEFTEQEFVELNRIAGLAWRRKAGS